MFQVAVKAKKGQYSFLQKAMITTSISAASPITNFLSKNKIEDLVFKLGNGSLEDLFI